jgi:hypothetical protein
VTFTCTHARRRQISHDYRKAAPVHNMSPRAARTKEGRPQWRLPFMTQSGARSQFILPEGTMTSHSHSPLTCTMLIWLITLTPLTFLLHAWLASLLLGSTRWNPLYHYPFSQHAIISPTTIDWLKDIHSKYDLPGISLGAIASPLYTSSEWKNQTFHLGHLENGELIDDEVSISHSNSHTC